MESPCTSRGNEVASSKKLESSIKLCVARPNKLKKNQTSLSVPDYLLTGEDDDVSSLRAYRYLKIGHSESMILPPPRKFWQDSSAPARLIRACSADSINSNPEIFRAKTQTAIAEVEFAEFVQSSESTDISGASTFKRNTTEDQSTQIVTSLEVIWESLMSGADAIKEQNTLPPPVSGPSHLAAQPTPGPASGAISTTGGAQCSLLSSPSCHHAIEEATRSDAL
jgi:hypothetical protein